MPLAVTSVRVTLAEPGAADRVLGYATLETEDLSIHDIKIIRGNSGYIVAMPARKLEDRCRGCGGRNPYCAAFCMACGRPLDPERGPRDATGRRKLYWDVLHPLNPRARRAIEEAVLEAYHAAVRRHLDVPEGWGVAPVGGAS